MKLAEAWNLKEVRIPNRIGLAPMSSNRAGPTGRMTESLCRFLERRAIGQCGFIILESATVDAECGATVRNLRLDAEEVITPLRKFTRRMKAHGVTVIAQLWHAGPRARTPRGILPVAPSNLLHGTSSCRPLSTGDISSIVRQFIEAGDRAARAGFDAVEIHAAHGYLLHHFADNAMNRRTDAYGGSAERRFRILSEICHGLHDARPGLPVLLRLSVKPGDDYQAIAKAVQRSGFDALDVRTGFSSMPSVARGKRVPRGYTLELCRELRPYLKMPIVTGGCILNPIEAEQAIREYGIDAVLLGRALLADPHWAKKAFAGMPVVPCKYDCSPSCYSRFKKGYALRCILHRRRL